MSFLNIRRLNFHFACVIVASNHTLYIAQSQQIISLISTSLRVCLTNVLIFLVLEKRETAQTVQHVIVVVQAILVVLDQGAVGDDGFGAARLLAGHFNGYILEGNFFA